MAASTLVDSPAADDQVVMDNSLRSLAISPPPGVLVRDWDQLLNQFGLFKTRFVEQNNVKYGSVSCLIEIVM